MTRLRRSRVRPGDFERTKRKMLRDDQVVAVGSDVVEREEPAGFRFLAAIGTGMQATKTRCIQMKTGWRQVDNLQAASARFRIREEPKSVVGRKVNALFLPTLNSVAVPTAALRAARRAIIR